MDLTTRCPHCGLTFAASLAQLQLRKGYIRCPGCAHIFDGFEAVVAADDDSGDKPDGAAAPQVVRQRAHRGNPAPREPSFVISGGRPGVQAPRAEPTISVRAAPAAGHYPDSGRAEPAIGPIEPGAGEADAPEHDAGGGHVFVEPRAGGPERAQPEFLESEPISYRGAGFYFWCFLSVLGLIVLLGQGLYVYRVQLANQWPALRPMLEQACGPLHCRIPYSREIGEVEIMNSSLQTQPLPDKAQGGSGRMTLHFTLRNKLDRPQEWPTIILELLDFSGTVVVKKNIAPSDYLSTDVLNRPFGAHTEVIAAVPIDMHGVKISGFKLRKFFP